MFQAKLWVAIATLSGVSERAPVSGRQSLRSGGEVAAHFMDSPRPHLFGLLAGLFLAAALCFTAALITGTWVRVSDSRTVTVTGSARKQVQSDLVIWRASFSTEAPTLLEAQRQLKADLAKVEAWLDLKAVKKRQVQPVQIRELMAHAKGGEADGSPVRTGYRLNQVIEIQSDEVERIPQLASESMALLEQGVAFLSESFEFIYTRANDAKVEMMAEATKDARLRAEQIAIQGNRSIKELRSARMGVIQINPLYSGAASWDGNNDTSSRLKTITATVNATFSLQ